MYMCVRSSIASCRWPPGDQGRWTFFFRLAKEYKMRAWRRVAGRHFGLSVAGGRGFADLSPCVSGRHWMERRFGGIGIAGWQPLPADSRIGRRAYPPHLLNYHTLRYPTIPALKNQTGNRSRSALETGEDHTRVGCYGTCPKVSRRGHLSVTSVRLNGSGSSIPT
jgi:hypothetical protein